MHWSRAWGDSSSRWPRRSGTKPSRTDDFAPSKDSNSLFDPAGRQLFRRIWGLTWPLIVANALELTVGLIDLWLVRPFGPAATAAIGVGRQVTFLVEAM